MSYGNRNGRKGADVLGDGPKPSQPAQTEAGPRKMTVGDLSANMIGSAVLRATYEDAVVEGTLTSLEIMTERDAEYSLVSERPMGYTYRTRIDLRIGNIALEDLLATHPVEVLR